MYRWVPLLVALCACESKEDSQPIADAGPDQLVTPGVTVTLDGTASSDRDGRIRNYAWTRVSAPSNSASPFEGSGANPAFTVDTIGRYVFSLSVTDDAGNLSHPDMVEVVAVEPAERPVAILETAGDLGVGLPLQLNGSKSTAAEDKSISVWSFSLIETPSGSAASLDATDTAEVVTLSPDEPGVWIVGLEVSDGTLASRVVTTTLEVTNQTNQPPVASCGGPILVEVDTVARVSGASSIDPEGEPITYQWVLGGPDGSNAAIFDTTAADASFIPDTPGDYNLSLTVSDGILNSTPCTALVQASGDTVENQAPIADAGPDQSVGESGVDIDLDGSESFDPEGATLSYEWSLASTPPASALTEDDIQDPSAVSSAFTPDEDGSYVVLLKVCDPEGLCSIDSVLLDVGSALNQPPIANAGENKDIEVGVEVALEGVLSEDPDGDSLVYQWSILSRPAGSSALLRAPTDPTSGLTADIEGEYVVRLEVNDGALSASDTTTVTAYPIGTPLAPVCATFEDQSTDMGVPLALDGTGTTDPNDDALAYTWSIESGPEGAVATFSHPDEIETTFTPDLPGTYQVRFTASDGTDECAETFVVESIDTTPNRAPVCDAGGDRSIVLGDTAILDGSATTDPDDDDLTYAWTIYDAPGAATPDIVDATSATARFTPEVGGVYTLAFSAFDGEEECSQYVVLDVQIPPPNTTPDCALSASPEVLVGESIVFDATGTTDADGDELTISWTLESRPPTSSAVPGIEGFTATLETDAPGTYSVSILVSDGEESCTLVAEAVASADNEAPICEVVGPGTATTGVAFELDATGSSDPDGDPLAYLWTVVERPTGSSALFADASSPTPSFSADVPGEYSFAVTISDADRSCIDSVNVVVETANTPPSCNAGDDTTVAVGEFAAFDGSGTSDADGDELSYYWYVIDRPDGSTSGLVSRDTVGPRFSPDVTGEYIIEITADDGTDVCSDTLTLTATNNTPPTCNAGLDGSTLVGEFIDLDATGSTDPDGDALTYYWSVSERPEGSTNGLVARETATARFQADVEGTYVFSVDVNDGTDSCTGTVTFTATTNTPPTCDAGTDIEGEPGVRALLDGTATADADGDALSYYWYVSSRPEGSVNGLIDREAIVAGFIPDVEGTYTFEITADDGTESCSDTVTLTVAGNTVPVCDAGPDVEGTRFVRATLDGSATSDADGDELSYYWYVASRPEGSVHGLIGRENPAASFIPDRSGEYTFELTATDGTESCTDSMTLTVSSGSAPVCDAGPDQSGEVGIRIDFDGTATSDPDGDTLSYYWYVSARPEGSVHGLINRESTTPGFIPDLPGDYSFEITASDGEETCTDVVDVSIGGDTGAPPVGDDTGSPPLPGDIRADAGRDQSLCDIDAIDLDGTDSIGTGLLYTWTFASTPSGSTLTDDDIEDADSPLASFTPDAEGRFEVQLEVSDDTDSDADTVAVTVDTSGSVLTLHLDEGSGTSTSDDSPYENDSSTLTGEWTGGRFFSGIAFEGADEIAIRDAPQLDMPSNFTIDWWMRTADIGEDWRAILTKGTEGDYNYSLWTYQDELHFYGVDTSGAYVSTSATSSTIGDGGWHHYAVTVTDSRMTLYEDGSVLASSTISNPLQTNDTDLYIGRPAYSTTEDTFVGSLDEVVVRAQVLSAENIAFIADSDTQYCTGDEDTRTPTGEITNPAAATSTDIGYVKVEGTASDESAIASVTVNGSTAAPTSDNFATWVAYVPLEEGRNTVRMQIEDVAGNVNAAADSVNVDRVDLCGDDTVLLLAFDEDEAGVATDWGPNENDGTEDGVSRVIGRYGNALSVGATGGVTVPHDPVLGDIDEISIEMWMRRDGPTEEFEVLAAKGVPASFGMLLFTDSLIFGFDDEDDVQWATTASGVTDGEWHHVVGVFDGSELALYVDGSLQSSTPTFGALPVSNTADITIGSYYGTGGFLDGQLDQLHIFTTALSASEVVDQFSAGESCPLGDNLALSASASASSTLNPLFRADNVIDNDTREEGTADYTMWLGEEGAAGWVTLDFGGVVGILRTRWANTHNRLAYDRATEDYRIEASTTGAFGDEAISIASGTGRLDEELVFNTEESTPVAARYLRFYSDSFVGLGPGLNEIQVYGLE